jgi:hypothetical protein
MHTRSRPAALKVCACLRVLQPEGLALAALAGDASNCKFDGDPGYLACQNQFYHDLIASTCIAAMLATYIMSVFARE